jgi:hypothetical protein
MLLVSHTCQSSHGQYDYIDDRKLEGTKVGCPVFDVVYCFMFRANYQLVRKSLKRDGCGFTVIMMR